MAANATDATLRSQATADKDSVYLTGLAMALGYSLGNPLTALSAQVKSLRRRVEADVLDVKQARLAIERVEAILEAATSRVSAVTQQFHTPRGSASICDLNDIVREAAGRYAHQTFCSRLRIDLELSELPELDLDRSQISRIVAELMLNAAEAMFVSTASDGLMTVRTASGANDVILQVHDSGGGAIDPERIFDMSHTTKRGRSGMGLSVARALALANGGQLYASANDRGGLTTTLTFPRPGPEIL
ncbi:sensor histidine kinase [Novosphingobium sp.]|uniref:sensor histidine kinase n=1 Tax=Novosphingobium sp. TaxID=1874826 RepID=UPI003D6CBB61